MIDIYQTNELVRKVSLKSTKILVVTMAVLLMVYSVFNIWLQLAYDAYSGDLTILVPFGATFVIALLSLFTKKVDIFRLIGLYALILGFQRLYLRVVMMDWDENVLDTIFSLIFIGLALNLMLTGISFTIGKVIRRSSMMITSLAMIVFELFTSELAINLEDDPDADIVFLLIFYKVCLIGMYLCIIGMMDSEIVRNSTKDAKYAVIMDKFRNEHQYDRGAGISSDVANALTDYSSPLWEPGPGGPVVAQLSFVIKGYSTEPHVIVQRWKDDDRLFFTMYDKPGSILLGNRCAVDKVIVNEDTIHMVGKDGTDAVLWVRD